DGRGRRGDRSSLRLVHGTLLGGNGRGPAVGGRHPTRCPRSRRRSSADPEDSTPCPARPQPIVFPRSPHYASGHPPTTHSTLPRRPEDRPMPTDKPIRVAIIGLGFGAEFIPIYQNYPGAEMYAICRRNKKGLDEVGDRYGIKACYTDFDAVLKDPN